MKKRRTTFVLFFFWRFREPFSPEPPETCKNNNWQTKITENGLRKC